MLRVLEEEQKSAAQKPRVMKKFSETRKAEKVVSKTDNNKATSPAIEVVEDEAGQEKEVENGSGGGSVNASPRNKALDKLATRGRGSARQRKTNSNTSKKAKEWVNCC